MSDLTAIKALEQQIGETFSLATLDTVMSGNSRCSYVLDVQQQVIALNLQNCKQTDLAVLKNFKHLTHLNISLNQLTQLSGLKYLPKLTQLNLQKNNLSDLHGLKELGYLTQLNLQDNHLTDIKPLRELKTLTVLNLQANQLSEIKYLAGLTELTNLNLSSNLLKELSALKGLKKLDILHLSSNQITELEALAELIELTELDLRFNQISQLEPLKKLLNLKKLYLSTNKISGLESLKTLQSLTHLYLSSNEISDISALKELTQLTELDLRANHISEIAALANLRQLTWLYLENNQLNDLKPLENLTELTQLNLRNNQIVTIEPLKNLKKLTQIYLSNNRIQILPKWLIDFNLKIKWNSGGEGISVVANPLKYPPPEIIRQGNTAIKNYFSGLEQQQQRAVNEIKICFVGDSDVGKSTLIAALSSDSFSQPAATDSISVSDWHEQNMTAHCWDFSGNDNMRPLQSLFFSEQCVYVLVLDNRPQRNETYWLRKIKQLARNAPILIVLNKCDQADNYDVNRKNLIKAYYNLQSDNFFSVSCTHRLGLEELKEGLKAAVKQISLFDKHWPESWIQVKNALVKELKQKYYVSAQGYQELCEQHGIKDKVNQEQLLELLHHLGVLLHFKNNHAPETYLLEPNWLGKTFAKLMYSPLLAKNNGLLVLKDLPVILKPERAEEYCYFVEHYKDLIHLMRQLELCFLIDKSHVLIPLLLPEQPTEVEFNPHQALKFRIYYEYLDELIITRLIAVLHEDIYQQNYWRSGMFLKNQEFDCVALVQADYAQRSIVIQLNGEKARDYFVRIRRILQHIEASLI